MKSLKQIINLNSLYVVDRHQNTVKEVPHSGAYKVCVRPEDWEPGKIYVPKGAVLVNALSEAAARQKVEEMFECSPAANLMELILEGPGPANP